MSQNVRSARIGAAYAELKKLIDSGGTTAKIIKATNKIVNDDHNQPEAWQCRVVAYVQGDHFEEAIKAVSKAPNKQQLQFEVAYCHYRLNDVAKALSVLDAAPDKDSPRGKELRAQILYRLEQFNECYTVFRDLVRYTADGMDVERSTNMAAAQVHRVMQGQCEAPKQPSPKASYEQWYNSGCAAAAAGDHHQALERLAEACKQCRMLLNEEGAAEEEVQQEQAIIRVQQGYVLQCDGRDKEAVSEYSAVLHQKIDDPVLLAILHNNLAVNNKDANVFDTRKKMKATQAPELVHKLTSVQRNQLALNNCILNYNSQQSHEDGSFELECERLLSSDSSTNKDIKTNLMKEIKMKAMLLLAASQAKTGKLEDAVKGLQKWAKENTEDTKTMRLAAAQLRLTKSDINGGISELMLLPEQELYRPGVVASIATLMLSKKQKSAVAKLFKEAAAWHHKNKSTVTSNVEQLLRRAADYHLKEGDPQAAAAALEQLRTLCPETAASCLPNLIQAYSQFNTSAAAALSKELPDSVSVSDVDTDALEISLGPKYFMKAVHRAEEKDTAQQLAADKAKEATAASADGGGGGGAGSRVKPRKKKRRKTILPKNYVAGEVPDSERWLPRWQRSGANKRRRDKRKEVGRGTQGGVGDTTDKYDITKNPGTYKSSTSAIQQQPEPAGPRRNMPKKKNKKK